MLEFWISQIFAVEQAKDSKALTTRLSIFAFNNPFDEKFESRCTKLLIFFLSLKIILLDGFSFLKTCSKVENRICKWKLNQSFCRTWAEWATSAVSSAKRISRIVTTFKFRNALRLARLKSCPSVLEWSCTGCWKPKTRFNSKKYNCVKQ